VGSPSDRNLAISVGSTNEDNQISYFSSVGPSKSGLVKPNLCAPGSNVISAWATGNTKYGIQSGSSMAVPTVAGTAALIVSYLKKGSWEYTISDVYEVLKKGVQPTNATLKICGGIKDNVYPNNFVGYGRIDAKVSLTYLSLNT